MTHLLISGRWRPLYRQPTMHLFSASHTIIHFYYQANYYAPLLLYDVAHQPVMAATRIGLIKTVIVHTQQRALIASRNDRISFLASWASPADSSRSGRDLASLVMVLSSQPCIEDSTIHTAPRTAPRQTMYEQAAKNFRGADGSPYESNHH